MQSALYAFIHSASWRGRERLDVGRSRRTVEARVGAEPGVVDARRARHLAERAVRLHVRPQQRVPRAVVECGRRRVGDVERLSVFDGVHRRDLLRRDELLELVVRAHGELESRPPIVSTSSKATSIEKQPPSTLG